MEQLKRRLPVLLLLGVAVLIWKGAFGFLASDRTVIFRLPLPASDVRSVEIQIFKGDDLLKREELKYPTGLTGDVQSKLPLVRGPHHALVWTEVQGSAERKLWKADFDPADEAVIVVVPK